MPPLEGFTMKPKRTYELGQPKIGNVRKSSKTDRRDAIWYIPVTVHEGISSHPIHESTLPHFSTIHDANEALTVAGFAMDAYKPKG